MKRCLSVIAVGAAACLSAPALGASVTINDVFAKAQRLGADLDAHIRAELDLSGYTIQEIHVPAEPGQAFQATVEIDGIVQTLNMQPHSIRSSRFRVLVADDNGMHAFDPPAPRTYRGFMDGAPQSRVAASLLHGGLHATILPDEHAEPWFVQPLAEILPGAPGHLHIVYPGGETIHHGWRCGLDDHADHNLDASDRPAGGGGGTRGDCVLMTEIAWDADFQYFQLNGSSVSNTISDIENVQNAVTLTYERDVDVSFEITEIIVRSTSASNPYTSSNPSTLLNQFRSWWNNNHQNIPRDIAHLMTGRNMGGVIGIAYLSSVCTTSGYAVSRGRFSSNMNSRLALVAHEIGHNFSAPHCNSAGECRIMCSSLGGCNGLGNPPRFAPVSRNTISNFAAGRHCLEEICSGIDITAINPPSQVARGEPTTFDVTIDPGDDTIFSGSQQLFFRFGGGTFESISLEHQGGIDYTATIPAATSCSDDVQFYVSAIGANSGQVTDPPDGPNNPFTATVICPLTIEAIDPPTTLVEGEQTIFNVEIDPGNDILISGSAQLFYRFDTGSAFTARGLTSLGGTLWRATIPAAPCVDNAEFYVLALGASTGVVTDPPGGADDPFVADVDCDSVCPPDWNGDGVVDSDDLFDFLSDWASGNADYNGDGVTDSDDLFDFLSDWANPGQFPGC